MTKKTESIRCSILQRTPHTGGPVAFSTAIITCRLLFVWCRKLFNLAVIDCITPMRSCRIRFAQSCTALEVN